MRRSTPTIIQQQKKQVRNVGSASLFTRSFHLVMLALLYPNIEGPKRVPILDKTK